MQKLQQHATTLVELLTILLLISAMVSYAVPAFSKWIDAHKQRSLQEKLLYQLQAARSQAVTRGETLEICASADGLQCQGSWSEGWLLKTAKTGDILMAEQITLSNSALQWSGYRDQVLFRSNGQTPSSNGRFDRVPGSGVTAMVQAVEFAGA